MREIKVQKLKNIIERIQKTTLRKAGNREYYVTGINIFLKKIN